MDARLKTVINSKIDEVIYRSNEVLDITRSLENLIDDEENVTFGIALGRLYNAFHYQTRRILKRNATEQEFEEFVVMLSGRAEEIKNALKLGKQHAHNK